MFQKLKNISRQNLIILIVAIVFILLPVILAIIFSNSNSQIATPTSENAFKNTIDDEISQAIQTQGNVDLSGKILHTIGIDGDWTAVMIFSVEADDYGNNALIILQKNNGVYQIKYFGTGCESTCLSNLGAPSGLVRQISNESNNGQKYTEIINNSQKNPRNKYPLLQKLPFTSDHMKITYSFESKTKDTDGVSIPTIIISGDSAAQRALGLQKIKNFGYDPGEYKITFKNFANPFTGGNK